ncbi:hypothetical protein V6Z12_D09G047700 [Gossypium hirsutum]
MVLHCIPYIIYLVSMEPSIHGLTSYTFTLYHVVMASFIHGLMLCTTYRTIVASFIYGLTLYIIVTMSPQKTSRYRRRGKYHFIFFYFSNPPLITLFTQSFA